MEPFKLKVKGTNLYYIPLRPVAVKWNGRTVYVKSNLSKKGKIYQSDPRTHISTIESHLDLIPDPRRPNSNYPVGQIIPIEEDTLQIEFLS